MSHNGLRLRSPFRYSATVTFKRIKHERRSLFCIDDTGIVTLTFKRCLYYFWIIPGGFFDQKDYEVCLSL